MKAAGQFQLLRLFKWSRLEKLNVRQLASPMVCMQQYVCSLHYNMWRKAFHNAAKPPRGLFYLLESDMCSSEGVTPEASLMLVHMVGSWKEFNICKDHIYSPSCLNSLFYFETKHPNNFNLKSLSLNYMVHTRSNHLFMHNALNTLD